MTFYNIKMWSKVSKSKVLVRYCAKLAKLMEKDCVVPDVIDCAPAELAEIIFPTGATVKCGKELTPTQVRYCPTIRWYAEYVYYYTLCMVDADAPCRKNPICKEWQHWLIGNVPGNCVSCGDVLAEYIGACPQKDTDLHRYVLLVYKQPAKCSFDEPRLSKDSFCNRDHFSIRKFASKYCLGRPVAGNFFVAQFDCYVPVLNKLLGLSDEVDC